MKDLPDEIAEELKLTREQVDRVIELFALSTHRSFYELCNDPIAALRWNTSPMGFFHFLGILRIWAEMSEGEFHPEEYLLRMGSREDWQPYSDQMTSWKRPEER